MDTQLGSGSCANIVGERAGSNNLRRVDRGERVGVALFAGGFCWGKSCWFKMG